MNRWWKAAPAHRGLTWLIAVVMAGCAASEARADGLQAELNALTPYLRSGGPVILDWTLTWDGPEIWVGVVELSVEVFGAAEGVTTRHDLVLQPGRQQIRLWLPALTRPLGQFVPADIRARFVDREGTVTHEGVFQRRIPTVPHHAFVIGYVGEWVPREVATAFDLRRRRPLSGRPEALTSAAVAVQVQPIPPRTFPATPLLLTGNDIVVVPSSAVERLSQKRWDTLDRWVRGGGAALVFVEPAMSASGRRRVAAWLRADAVGVPWEDGGAQAVKTERNATGPRASVTVVRMRHGFGRLVVVLGPADGWRWQDLRAEASYLWRLVDELPRSRVLSPLPQEAGAVANRLQLRSGAPGGVAPPGKLVGNTEWPFLRVTYAALGNLPAFPLRWLLGIAIGFVLWIGPCEYLLARRGGWRWRGWTFPVMSLLATWAIVGLAQGHFRSAVPRVQWVITDIDETAQVARTNELTVLFSPHSTRVRRECDNEVTGVSRGGTGQYKPPVPFARNAGSAGPPRLSATVSGRFPLRYALEYRLPQWLPVRQRRFAFGPLPAGGRAVPGEVAGEDRGPYAESLRGVLEVVRGLSADQVGRAFKDAEAAGRLSRLLRERLPAARCAAISDHRTVRFLFGRSAGEWRWPPQYLPWPPAAGDDGGGSPGAESLANDRNYYVSRCFLPVDVRRHGPARCVSPSGGVTLEDISPLVVDRHQLALSIVMFEQDETSGHSAASVWTFRCLFRRAEPGS